MKASRSYYQVRAYNVRHRYDVNGFLEAYRRLLQKAVDEIWLKSGGLKSATRKRLIPMIPKDNSFKNHLNSSLLEGWSFLKHYVD